VVALRRGQSLRVTMQPEREDELRSVQGRGEPKQTSRPKGVDDRAAEEIRERRAGRPDDVIDADHARSGGAVIADVAGHRFEHGPCKTNTEAPEGHHADLPRERGQKRARAERHGERAETEIERGEVTAALREPAGKPRREDVDEAVERGEGEVLLIPEAKLGAEVKENVIKVRDAPADVQELEDEAADF
jgi:hypothetical protein